MKIGDQSYVLGLFNATSNASSTDSNGLIVLDLSGLATGGSAGGPASGAPVKRVAPTPPWNRSETPIQASAKVQAALSGQSFINEGEAKLDLPGASSDYKKLFALYQGLATLVDIANRASGGISPLEQANLSKAFDRGLKQVTNYIDTSTFAKLRLAEGETSPSDTANLKIDKIGTTYITPPLATSLITDVPAFAGALQFNIAATRNHVTNNVAINLNDLGSQPRSLANVITYINAQLASAGVETRVATSRIPGAAARTGAGGVKIAATPDQYALKINIGTSEVIDFSAPQTAGAVYVGQTVGDPNPDGKLSTNDATTRSQLLKFQTDTVNVAAPPQVSSQPNFVDGRTFAYNLDTGVGTVHAIQVGADGSVYSIADATHSVEGQAVKGKQDTVLLKHDSAGHLIYARTLGASDSATGLGLAVSADGQVAVVGSVTGKLNGAVNGALNSAAGPNPDSDSFVTLYDPKGNETWTERRGALLRDQASQVAFSADGKTVYVAGQAQGSLPGSPVAPSGGYDGYIEAFQTSATGVPSATFTQTFGTAGQDTPRGLVVDGNALITASVENGHAVLRNYDISSGAPVLSNTRDLGDLQGGNITGLALNAGRLVIAGTSSNGALAAGAITRAASGGSDAFAAQLSEDLNASGGDAIAYYGGTGDDKSTGLSVSGGQVWIAGEAGAADLPAGQIPVGKKDGFIAQLDIATGAVVTSQRFTGKSGLTAVTALAVDTTGASVLDRLGLPKGTLGADGSKQLTAHSALRAGEQFTVGPINGPAITITIASNETLDTLATKIQRASGSQATATVTTVAGQFQLKIVPAYGTSVVKFGAGPSGKNALTALGIPEGVLAKTTTTKGVSRPADGGSKIYGLNLSSTLNIDSAAQISHVKATVVAALGVVRRAYQDLVTAATPHSAATAAANGKKGQVPPYLTSELANLKAGLERLTAGNTGSAFRVRTTA